MATFWEKNKQKSKWALLLLLLRWRKGVVPLLLVVLLIMFLFTAPSNLLAFFVAKLSRFPGGARAAAGITWLASRMGLSGFGEGDQHSFEELLAAFRAAKDARGASWGTFFRGGSLGPGAGNGDSLGMVRGNLGDVAGGGGANLGAQIKGGDSVKGIMTPDEAKKAGNAVAISPDDLAGERAGLVQSAYADPAGLVTGKRFGAGFSDPAGGAFASQGFLAGYGHAVNPDNTRSTLSQASVPTATPANAATRRKIGWSSPSTLQTGGAASAHNYGKSGGMALGQLVQGRNAGLMSSSPICTIANGCPPEYAATNMGSGYDGAEVGSAITGAGAGGGAGTGNTTPPIIAGPTSIDGMSTPNIPDPNTPLDPQGQTPDPTQINNCMQALNQCEQGKGTYRSDLEQQVKKINQISSQMSGDCSDPCNCNPCTQDQNNIQSICSGPITQDQNNITAPCQLPDYCSQYIGNGLPAPTPTDPPQATQCDPSQQNVQSCGCGNIFCDIGCALGS